MPFAAGSADVLLEDFATIGIFLYTAPVTQMFQDCAALQYWQEMVYCFVLTVFEVRLPKLYVLEHLTVKSIPKAQI